MADIRMKAAIFAMSMVLLAGFVNGFYAGKLKEIPNAEKSSYLHRLASFAVNDFNREHKANLSLSKVIKGQVQLSAGMVYYLTVEVLNQSQKHHLHHHPQLYYEAVLWVVPWTNFTRLQDFHLKDMSEKSQWREIGNEEPCVKEAAENAVKFIQQRSNSLDPYELQGIVSAMQSEDNGLRTLKLLLKVKWQNKLQHYKVVMKRHADRKWTMESMEQLPENKP